jgi:hypothetical protein
VKTIAVISHIDVVKLGAILEYNFGRGSFVALAQMLLEFVPALADSEASRRRKRSHPGRSENITRPGLVFEHARRLISEFVIKPLLPESGRFHYM